MIYRTLRQRINPEFVGVAARYSEQKDRRKTEEKEKKSLQSNRMFTESTERKLQRSIYSKSVELNRLQTSRMRKLEEIREKEQMTEMKRLEIAQLKEKNIQRKQEIKKRLQQSRMQLQTSNHQGWKELKNSLKQQTKYLQVKLKEKAIQNAHRAENIKKGQVIGLQRVHHFHQKKNNESLQAYMSRIKLENRLKKQNESHTRKLKKNLEQLSKSVALKKNFLTCLEQQIGKFKNDVRSFNSARLKPKQRVEGYSSSTFGTLPFQTLYKDNK